LWPYGYSSTGDVSFESAAYVARYVTKKITGKAADSHYEHVDADGVVSWRTPEFSHMSLKPGIAYGWIKKYMADVYPHDYVILKGKKRTPPRYYDRMYERFDVKDSRLVIDYDPIKNTSSNFVYSEEFSPLLDALKMNRSLQAREFLLDNTPERRKDKELVTLANFSKYSRSLT
jgi:hypothetical protein